jgi:tRNA threonylcarbamoyladenosine biosynthesis protein TsaB
VARSAPLLLAFETATRVVSVALLRGGELVGEERAPVGRPAAETLLPTLDALLARCDADVGSVDAFAVSVGPGSFTSLRIGVATVKALAFGSPRPVAPVPTLAALARTAPETGLPVVATLDARRGEVYAAAYEHIGDEPRVLLAAGVYTPEELAHRLPPACALVGEGIAVCGEQLRKRLGSDLRLYPPPESDPRARHVGALGAALLSRGGGIDSADLVPHYLRRAEAEVQRTGERFERWPQRP